MRPTALELDVRLGPEELRAALAADALAGLTSDPKQLPPKWLYDETGCELFDEKIGRASCRERVYVLV